MTAIQLGDLLRVLDEDLDNLAHWHPLADWLIERGDPRGELINLDLALEAGDANTDALRARRDQILAESAPKLLGETFARVIADHYGAVTWRRGFVDSVSYVGNPNLRHRKAVGWLIKLMRSTPEVFALLRRLELSHTDFTDCTLLLDFTHLVELDLTGCQPTAATLTILAETLPSLSIIRRDQDDEDDYSMNPA